MQFEWDEEKGDRTFWKHSQKHGVRFEAYANLGGLLNLRGFGQTEKRYIEKSSMTQADDRLPPFHPEPGNAEPDDEMLPEYDLSQLAQGVRGKFADAMRQGYSVTVHHENGTSTTRHISPDSMSNDKNYSWYGDRIAGDKIGGDKIGGDKIGGDKVGGDKTVNYTVNYNASTAELLQIIAALRQTATQFPPELQTDITIDLDDVETEVKKPENQRNFPRLKKRLAALALVGAAIATPIAGMTDFANNAIDLGGKLGIELPTAP